ncbi:MAG: 30S ribosomal protein S6 [Candidatus Omnitrophica bacterium]|nr:30S ribosomal protein S6 [Candidatus Omnitrophota bacterium]
MEKTRNYSALFIIDAAQEDTIDEKTKKIKEIITENKGVVTSEKMIGKKRLAYLVQKKSEGIYYELNFTGLPSSITKINGLCRINTAILRTIIDKAE